MSDTGDCCIWQRLLNKGEHSCALFCKFARLKKTHLSVSAHLDFAYTCDSSTKNDSGSASCCIPLPHHNTHETVHGSSQELVSMNNVPKDVHEHHSNETIASHPEYRSQQSEPAKLSEELRQQLQNAPKTGLMRSVSHAPLQRQQNVNVEFNLTDSEKKNLLRKTSSSGYGTLSKSSLDFAEDAALCESAFYEAQTRTGSSTNNSEASLTRQNATSERETCMSLRLRKEPAQVIRMAESVSSQHSEITSWRSGDSHPDIIFDLTVISDLTVTSPSELIPTTVENYSVTPPQSLAVSDSSVDLGLEFYDKLVGQEELDPTAKLISSSELAFMSRVPDIDEDDSFDHGVSEHHDRYALTVFDNQPSMELMRYNFDLQITERKATGFSDAELDVLQDQLFSETVQSFVQERLKVLKITHLHRMYILQWCDRGHIG